MMSSERIGDVLVKWGRITPLQLEDAVALQLAKGCRLGEALVELQYSTIDDVARALAEQLDLPFFELDEQFKMEKDEVKLLPENIAVRYGVIPLKRDADRSLTLVMKDPTDVEAVDTVRALTHMEVHKAVSSEPRIMGVIRRCYRDDAHIEKDLRDIVDLEVGNLGLSGDEVRTDMDQLRVLANDAPVVRFVNLLLMQAVRDRASDIHFEPGEQSCSVRIRVDGLLREVTPPPRNLYQAVVTRIKILSNMDITERRLPLDGRFKFKVEDRAIDVRVSSLPEVYGEKLVLRLLDRRSMLVDMKDIGFQADMLQRFQKVLGAPYGIVLITGPTGSGKTSTLYAALNFLRDPKWNIQTVEDPVEYVLSGINQMQAKPSINLDFAEGLRAILRQDPDIIMIGEIRDMETARIAMRASLTGHLVLSTLHTNDAPSALWRLKDIGIEPYLIAATMRVVLSQRLVRVICGNCRRPYVPSPEVLKFAVAHVPEAERWSFDHGTGCHICNRTGYYGRTGVFEYLEVTDPIKVSIRAGTDSSGFRRQCAEGGMETLLLNGLRKVKDRVTTLDEVLVVCETD
jgi:type IV pilus assembly protein PilB